MLQWLWCISLFLGGWEYFLRVILIVSVWLIRAVLDDFEAAV